MTDGHTDDVHGLYQRIGQALVQAAPPGWVEVRATYVEAGTTGELQAVAVLSDGSYADLGSPALDLYDALSELRQLTHQPGRGAWYTAVVTVTYSGSIDLDLDHDSEPQWDVDVVPESYVEDLEMFPRDEEHRPAWLREKLRLAGG